MAQPNNSGDRNIDASVHVPSDDTNAQENSSSPARQRYLHYPRASLLPLAHPPLQQRTVQNEQNADDAEISCGSVQPRPLYTYQELTDEALQELDGNNDQDFLLRHAWHLWSKQGKDPIDEWGRIADASTSSSFWRKLGDGVLTFTRALTTNTRFPSLDFAVFRKKDRPVFEDYAKGGAWIMKFAARMPENQQYDPRDEMWLNGPNGRYDPCDDAWLNITMKLLIGDRCGRYDDVLGIVYHIEKNGEGYLEVWIKDANDHDTKEAIGAWFTQKSDVGEMDGHAYFQPFVARIQCLSELVSDDNRRDSHSDASMANQSDHGSSESDEKITESAALDSAWSIWQTLPPTTPNAKPCSNFKLRNCSHPCFNTEREFYQYHGFLRDYVERAIAQGYALDVGVFNNSAFRVKPAWEDFQDGGAAVIIEFEHSNQDIPQARRGQRQPDRKDPPDAAWILLLIAMIRDDFSFADDILGLVLHFGVEGSSKGTIELWLKSVNADVQDMMAEIEDSLIKEELIKLGCYEPLIKNGNIRFEPFSFRLQNQNMALGSELLKVSNAVTKYARENQKLHSENQALRLQVKQVQEDLRVQQQNTQSVFPLLQQYADLNKKLLSEKDQLRAQVTTSSEMNRQTLALMSLCEQQNRELASENTRLRSEMNAIEMRKVNQARDCTQQMDELNQRLRRYMREVEDLRQRLEKQNGQTQQ